MKRYLELIAIVFLMSLISQSCSIEKRRYSNGFHITTTFRLGNELQKGREAEPADEMNVVVFISEEANEEVVTTAARLEDVELVEDSINRLEPIQMGQSADRNPKGARKIRLSSELKKYSKAIRRPFNIRSTSRLEGEEDEDRSWFKALLGVMLGVLLALIVLPILCVIMILIFSSNPSDVFQFREEYSDSSFKRGFKRAYNGVVRIGLLIIWILSAALLLTLFLVELYLTYGLLSVILAILLILLICLLLAILLDRVFDFIFRGD